MSYCCCCLELLSFFNLSRLEERREVSWIDCLTWRRGRAMVDLVVSDDEPA